MLKLIPLEKCNQVLQEVILYMKNYLFELQMRMFLILIL